MSTATKPYKRLKRIKDQQRFSIENIEQFTLTIFIGTREFQLSIFDQNKRCLLFEDYVFAETKNVAQKRAIIQQIYEDHHLLMAGFWGKVNVIIKNKFFTFIPDALYLEEHNKEYLNATCGIEEDYHVSTNKIDDFINLFAYDRQWDKFLTSYYPTITPNFYHQGSAIVKGIKNTQRQQPGRKLYLYVDRFILHAIILDFGHLIYYNRFGIKSFDDYIKYFYMVASEFEIDLASDEVKIWGYLTESSPHFVEFRKYINNISFGNRPANLHFGYMFDELPDHQFLEMFSLV